MEKDILEKYINECRTLRDIAKLTNKCVTSVRYWLKKYKLKTYKSVKKINTICKVCGKKTKDGRMFCGYCSTKINRLRQRIALIKYKGGKCIKCGYSDNISVLEFHHKDPKKKDFVLGAGVKSWSKMKKEVDKCDLYCSNCHRLEHSNGYWCNLILFVKNYKGKNKELKTLLQ
jgi:hypothetical protein